MNYGYSDADTENHIVLNAEDEKNRMLIQLYHHVASRIPITDKKVLEVGSGRGGGASYIARYLKPSSMVGIDLSENAIEFCNNVHFVKGLKFQVGDAENLPFNDNSFDAVINVESSHCYGNIPKFLKEVVRVLSPGGYFLFCDLRSKDATVKLNQKFKNCELKIVDKEVITESVLQALDEISDRKTTAINANVPMWIRKAFLDFAGSKGTKVYNGFKSGEIIYLSYVLRKM